MTLGELIKQYRTKEKMSMDEFAERSGLSKGYISMLEKNQNPKTGQPIAPSLQTIKNASNGMNMDFEKVISMIDQNVQLNDSPLNSILESSPDIFPIKTKKVPIIGGIACGEPIFHEEDFASYVETDIETKADFAMRCHGDSMINIGVKDGDIALIRSQPLVNNGEIAAVNIDGEFTLKRFYDYGNIIVLRAENPKFPDLEYKKGDADNIIILGKAIAYQSWIY